METSRRLKITVVGDGMVGKTCLLYVYTKNEFPTEYVPTVFDNFVDNIVIDDMPVEVVLWDTAGQEDYERLRPLSYSSTDCFVVCYSVGSRASFENITLKWYPELKHFNPLVPIVLVATKIDLRSSDKAVVTTQDGKKMAKKIRYSVNIGSLQNEDSIKQCICLLFGGLQVSRAIQLVECSALDRINIQNVFDAGTRAALKKKVVRKRTCQYL